MSLYFTKLSRIYYLSKSHVTRTRHIQIAADAIPNEGWYLLFRDTKSSGYLCTISMELQLLLRYSPLSLLLERDRTARAERLLSWYGMLPADNDYRTSISEAIVRKR